MSTPQPPPGGDQNRAPLLNAVEWTLTSLSIVFVGCRLFTRLRIVRSPGLDDVFIIISIVRILVQGHFFRFHNI